VLDALRHIAPQRPTLSETGEENGRKMSHGNVRFPQKHNANKLFRVVACQRDAPDRTEIHKSQPVYHESNSVTLSIRLRPFLMNLLYTMCWKGNWLTEDWRGWGMFQGW